MDIPEKDEDRFALFETVLGNCFSTQETRKPNYNKFRQFYLFGTDNGDTDQTYNKIYPHIDQILSFMYSNETTKFSIELGASVEQVEIKRVPKLNKAINDEWHASNGDLTFMAGLEWAHVYGSTFMKLRWNGKQIEPFIVDPHDFGVLREDVSQLSRQEAFAQEYWITKGQLEYELLACEHPRAKQIIASAATAIPRTDKGGDMMSRLVSNSAIPTSGGAVAQGNYNGAITIRQDYLPKVSEPLIKMTELYVFDNKLQDFRVVTLASPFMVVFDRPINRMFVDHEIPFVQICPNPDHNYFWGRSEVERLMPLQMMRTDRMDQIRRLMSLQAKPPTSLIGFEGITDEMVATLNSPGGFIASAMPGAKADQLTPQIPDDLFKDIGMIDSMFEEMSGITNVMSGRGEAGVRSTGHASQLARLGSSRAKKRALLIEDSLEKVATLYLQIMQRYDDETDYRDEDGDTFAPHQFTKDYVVKVDAHSNSPIFTEDQADKAMELFKAKAITRERLIEMMGVPMEQLLKQDLKDKIEPAEARQAEKQDQQEKLKLHHGGKM
jgi:hypothetical protein